MSGPSILDFEKIQDTAQLNQVKILMTPESLGKVSKWSESVKERSTTALRKGGNLRAQGDM